MKERVFVLVRREDWEGGADPATFRAGGRLAGNVTALALGSACDGDAIRAALNGMCHEIWIIGNGDARPDALLLGSVLSPVFPKNALLLMLSDSFGMDVGPGLSVILDLPLLTNSVAIEDLPDGLRPVRFEYGGQVRTGYLVDISHGGIITIQPGSFQSTGETIPEAPIVIDKTGSISPNRPRRRFLGLEEAGAKGVDIASAERLVAVGRGMQDEENITIAREVAMACGAELCCSRPVVDSGLLEKERQVGISGTTVSPRLYLACGISGSFKHMVGIKGSPFIIAINKNPSAPIFQEADVGIVADAAKLLPLIADKLRESAR